MGSPTPPTCRSSSPGPFTTDLSQAARCNTDFRSIAWTGRHLQLSLMCIPVCGEVGLELHPDTDQLFRVEEGQGMVRTGVCRERSDQLHYLTCGDVLCIPAGLWHNVINTGRCPLKLTSLYAPPQHPPGTVHHCKADAAHP